MGHLQYDNWEYDHSRDTGHQRCFCSCELAVYYIEWHPPPTKEILNEGTIEPQNSAEFCLLGRQILMWRSFVGLDRFGYCACDSDIPEVANVALRWGLSSILGVRDRTTCESPHFVLSCIEP
jgi:hypothetical protein